MGWSRDEDADLVLPDLELLQVTLPSERMPRHHSSAHSCHPFALEISVRDMCVDAVPDSKDSSD